METLTKFGLGFLFSFVISYYLAGIIAYVFLMLVVPHTLDNPAVASDFQHWLGFIYDFLEAYRGH